MTEILLKRTQNRKSSIHQTWGVTVGLILNFYKLLKRNCATFVICLITTFVIDYYPTIISSVSIADNQ